jgi:GTP:adenosylcobinamide-phosphate guanylyltransferase
VDTIREQGLSEKILVVPTDVPFITPEAIEDFLACCEASPADFYYPLTRKEVNDHKYPGVVRTYVRLKEGVFTGGNLFLLSSQAIPACLEIGVKLFDRRKEALAIARLFGIDLVLKYLLGRLSIQMAEKRFLEVVGIRGKGIISSYAEVGVDVDKPTDLRLAEKYLGGIDLSR